MLILTYRCWDDVDALLLSHLLVYIVSVVDAKVSDAPSSEFSVEEVFILDDELEYLLLFQSVMRIVTVVAK